MGEKKRLERRDAFLGLHLDLHPTEEDTALGADISEDNIKALINRVKPEHIAYDCKGHPGYTGYPSKVGTSSPGIIKDSLALWRKVTREMGILMGIHYSGVWDYLAVKQHPKWARIDENGKSDTESTSVFGPYVDELLIPQLKEVVELYDVDSVWLDGECWGTKIDYSQEAVRQWKEETGYTEVPKHRDEPHWREWKEFQRRAFERYLCHWIKEIHSSYPNLNAASNWAYTTMMPKEVVAQVDFISGDFDPMLSVDRARTETRYLSNVGLPWELQSWGFDLDKRREECLKLPDHLKQEASVVLMHGGGYMMYFLPTRSGYINETIINTAGEVADFCRERKELCFRSTSVPQVALLYSNETQFDRSDRVYTWWDTPLIELEGTLHALLELHYSVDILSEHMLKTRMKEFPMVVVPDSYKLSEEFCSDLLKYVENGGKLLLLGNRCARLFEKNLGVKFKGEPFELKATLDTSRGKILAYDDWQDIEILSAEVIAYRYHGEGTQNRSAFIDVRSQGVSVEHSKNVHIHPAATLTQYGKGSIAAVYGAIPKLYFNNHHPFMRAFIGDIVARIFSDPMVKMDAPSCVELSLRKSYDGKLCIHLLNLSNMPVSDRRAYAEYIPSIENIKLEICCDKKPDRIQWEPSGEELSYEWKDSKLKVTIPKLHIHGVVVIFN